MTSSAIFVLSVLRVLVEVAGYALLGQGILAVIAGKSRHANPVYRLFQIVTNPAIRLVRLLTPGFVLDRHIPFVTFFALFWLWVGLALAKRYICVAQGLVC